MFVVVWEPKHGRGSGHQTVMDQRKAEQIRQAVTKAVPDATGAGYGRARWRRGCSGTPAAECVTGALAWIEGPVWTAEIEDTCRYPDDDDPGAFLVSIRFDEDGLRIDVEHSTRGNRLDSDWIEGADLAQAKARAETMMARFVERWRAYHAEHWRQHDADTEGDAG